MHPAVTPARGIRSCVRCRQGRAAGRGPQSPGDEWQQESARDKRRGRGKKDEAGGGTEGTRQGHDCPPTATDNAWGVCGQGGALPQVSQAGRDAKGPGDGHRPPAMAGIGTATKLGTARPSGHLRVAKGGGTIRGSPHPVPGETSLCLPSRPPQALWSPREWGLAGTFPCASSLHRRPPRSVPHCPRRRPVTPGAGTMSRLTGQGQAGSPGPHPGPRRGPPRSSPLPHPSLRDPITADKRH